MILTLDDAQEYIAKLEAENAALRQQVTDLEQEVQDTFTCIISHHEEEIKHEVEPLRQQVEDLKCCGNCKSKSLGCFVSGYQDHYCQEWQSDNLTRRT
jgi:archaellum component FlaC